MVYVTNNDETIAINPNAPKNPIIHFDILLDNKDVLVGSEVTGKVVIQLIHDFAESRQLAIKFEGLKYKIDGPHAHPVEEPTTTSANPKSTKTDKHRAEYHHTLFHRNVHQTKSLSNYEIFHTAEDDVWHSTQEHKVLPEGHHEYTFKFPVPKELPPTGALKKDQDTAELVLYRVHAIVSVGRANILGNQEAVSVVHVLPVGRH
ncbi:hypothetical protein HDV00_003485 [Rhizophlyctis rosea]|nr:hypothetical protein HDV00_003485 [Rhizophlyctis rosea]